MTASFIKRKRGDIMPSKIRALFAILLFAIIMTGCGKSNSVNGKWEVYAYEVNGEKITDDDEIGEMFGYLILEYKKHQVTLKSDGSCHLKCSDFNGGTKEFDGTYVQNDNTIDITFSDEVITLDYIDGELSWVLPDSGVRICMKK